MTPSRAAWLLAASWAVAAGCSADPGDSLKAQGGTTTPLETDAGPPDDVGASGSSSGSSSGAASDDASGSSANDGSTSGSTSAEAGPDAAPIAAVGAGCGDGGAAVVTLSPASGSYSANTGNFMTKGPVCVELRGSVHQGWCVSNGQGRMVTLTSADGVHAPVDASAGCIPSLPAAPQAASDGYVYWSFTGGDNDYTSLYIY